VKNLLKFMSIGLVLAVVVFAQQMNNSSAVVEAADVAQNDIEFMNAADEVVKFYKADSSGQTVYLYVRDTDLNTTFTGSTSWISSHATNDRVVNAGATWTLDLNNSAKTIVAASLLEQKVTGTLTCLTGCAAAAGRNDANIADAAISATSGSGDIASIRIDVTMANDGVITAYTVDGTLSGRGFQLLDTVTLTDGLSKSGETNATASTARVDTIATVAGTVGNFTKTEDTDNGVTSGPNLFNKASTPVKLNSLTVKKGNTSLFTDALDETNGTFSLNANTVVGNEIGTGADDGVKASYSFKAQDVYTGLAAGAKRVHVTSTSDSTGEWIEIKEVSDEGVANNNFAGAILTGTSSAADATRTAGTYTVLPGEYTYTGTGLGGVFTVTIDATGAGTVTSKDGQAGAGYAAGNAITFPTAKIGATGADLVYTIATVQASAEAAVDTGIFMGNVKINTDASAGAADNGSVWVQDGDTLTASFYKAKNATDNATGDLIKATTATVDSTAPTISNVSPADGTLTKDTTPSLEFTIEDAGSGFDKSVSNFGQHVEVTVNGCDIPTAALGVKSHSTSAITVSYNAAVDWTTNAKTGGAVVHSSNDCKGTAGGNATDRDNGGFNITSTGSAVALTSSTVHGTKFTWYIKATDDATNAKELGNDVHNFTGLTTSEMDLRIDTKVPSATAITGAKAWSASEKKDVVDNTSVKISFDESLDANSVAASDFTVSGVGVTSSTIETVTMGGTDETTDMYVYLKLAADLGPNAKPKVKLVGEVTDKALNVLKPSTTETTGKTLGTASDSVKPTLSDGAIDVALMAKDGKTTYTFGSNENLTKTSGTFNAARGTYGSISGGGKTSGSSGVVTLDQTDTGKVSITLSNPTSGKGTVKHKTAHGPVLMTKTGIYGIASVGRDAADNVGVGGVTKVVEDVSAYFAAGGKNASGDDNLVTTGSVAAGDTVSIKLKNWPLADHDGDGSLEDSITKITVGGSVPTTMQYIDGASPTGDGRGGFRSTTSAALTGTAAAVNPNDNNTDSTFTIVTTQAMSSADGAGATAVVTTTDAAYTLVSITGGSGYAATETITIPDELIGDSQGDDVAPIVITLATVSTTDGTATATNSTVSSFISAVDWSENELITLKSLDESDVNIVADSTVKITYYYVNAEQTVELDLDGPIVTISPANLDNLTDKTPSISFAWDDDEYAGDNYTTVVITKAEILDPDSVTTDISGNLTTTDDKTFYYRPDADLAVGEYKLTISAEDTAGNETKDQTSKFTVKDRAKTVVPMEPGWNLISIPAAAADSDINAVITNTQVETVLTYDPSTPGGWLTAVRDGDALVGTLSAIDAEHGYWVFQKNGDDIKVDLPGYKGGAASVPPAISIVEGWNLIPAVSLTVGETVVATTIDPDKYLLGIDWVKAKGWDAVNEKWLDVSRDLTVPPNMLNTSNGFALNGNTITFGKGYWLYSSGSGVIVP